VTFCVTTSKDDHEHRRTFPYRPRRSQPHVALWDLAFELLRDEVVVGSNPATSTQWLQVKGLIAKNSDQALDRLIVI
jgi:hypothetical protein